jgi:type IV pilus assembly protein PilZ
MLQGKVILARYHTKPALSQAFLGFTRDGGLFIPTAESFEMQEPVFLVVSLPDNSDVFCVRGQVVWLSNGRRRGIGVHFHPDEAGKQLRHAVEGALGALLTNTPATLTM